MSDLFNSIDQEISEALHEDQEYLKLSPKERVEMLERLNCLLEHTLYKIGE